MECILKKPDGSTVQMTDKLLRLEVEAGTVGRTWAARADVADHWESVESLLQLGSPREGPTMLEICPHCDHSALFNGAICPNCQSDKNTPVDAVAKAARHSTPAARPPALRPSFLCVLGSIVFVVSFIVTVAIWWKPLGGTYLFGSRVISARQAIRDLEDAGLKEMAEPYRDRISYDRRQRAKVSFPYVIAACVGSIVFVYGWSAHKRSRS